MFIRVARVSIHRFKQVERLELDLASVKIHHAKVLRLLITGVGFLKDIQANKTGIVGMNKHEFLHGDD